MITFAPIRQETWNSADNAAYAEVELGIRRFGLDHRSSAVTPNENVVSYFLYYALDSIHNGDAPSFIHAVAHLQRMARQLRFLNAEFSGDLVQQVGRLLTYANITDRSELSEAANTSLTYSEMIQNAVSELSDPAEQQEMRNELTHFLVELYQIHRPRPVEFYRQLDSFLKNLNDDSKFDPYSFFQSGQRKIAEFFLLVFARVMKQTDTSIRKSHNEVATLQLLPPLPVGLDALAQA